MWVDVSEVERKLRGEPTPEYYEETDDDSDLEDGNLPSPPASVKGKPVTKKRSAVSSKRSRKRKERRSASGSEHQRASLALCAPTTTLGASHTY